MRTFEQYIRESYNFRLGGKANKGVAYEFFPKNKDELQALVEKLRKERGEDGDFNDIDTSNVTDMRSLFFNCALHFNGDISQWDTSNVTDMSHMFCNAEKFNREISDWDTSKVADMSYMFEYAYDFNQDISNWDVSKVINNVDMFYDCPIKEEYKPKFNI